MRILIANDGLHAHAYERSALLNALQTSGIEATIYNCKMNRAFDVFDSYEPDVFIGQLYNMDSATVKCIKERPHLRLALRAGEFSKTPNENPHILQSGDYEISVLKDLLDNCGKPDFIFTHYMQKDIENTHECFSELGVKLVGIPMSADINSYLYSNYDNDLACDIGFVGGYWPYKGKIIDKYLTPILSDYTFKVKIFGNQVWPHVNQYCGILSDEKVKDLFLSSKICPNLSEPHSQEIGIDVNERAFKILCSGGFCIMDNVRAAKEIFQDGVVFAETPNDFRDKIEFYLDPKNIEKKNKIAETGKNIVLSEHTNYHRAALFLESFGYPELASECIKTLNLILQRYNSDKNNNIQQR